MSTPTHLPMSSASRQIPEEIIAMILGYILYVAPENPRGVGKPRSGRAMIAPLARVSPIWRAEVERLLYDHIALFGPFNIVRCFITIAYGRRGVGRYVKCLHIALQDYDSSRGLFPFQAAAGSGYDGGRLLVGFARLVRDALFSMRQLTSYNLAIGRYSSNRLTGRATPEDQLTRPFLPLNAPFKLQGFSCVGLSLNALLVGFLRDQNAITRLDAPSLTSRYRLGPPVLPGLRAICGTAGLLRRVVPGRPVDSVRCTSPVVDAPFIDLVERLRESSCPLREFILPSVLLTAARDYLPVLANNLPSLESLVVSDHIPTSLSGAGNMNPYEMYKEEGFLHALSKFADLKDLTVYGKPLASARLPPYIPALYTSPTPNTETEASSTLTVSDTYEGDGSVDANDASPGGLQGDDPLLGADIEQDHMAHNNILHPPTQPGVPAPAASVSGHHQHASDNPEANNAGNDDGSEPPPFPATTTIPAWNQVMDVFGPLQPGGAVAGAPAGNAPHAAVHPIPPSLAHLDLAGDNTHPQPAGINHLPPPPILQPNPVAGDDQQPGPAPPNGNGGPGINITFDFGPGVNPPNLGGAFLQQIQEQIQAVTTQIVHQLAAPLGNVIQPTAQPMPPPEEDLDVDMILDDDPPNPGDVGGPFGIAGAFVGLPHAGFGAPGPGVAGLELPPGAVFGGAVHIDAVLQLGPLPGGNLNPAAFPAGIGNAPVPAAQLHPGPLPPNHGVPAPPVGHFPAAFPVGIVNAPVPAAQFNPGPLPPNQGVPAPVGHFPAAFPAGIVNAPVPAAQLHPGPLPPNQGVPAPPVGHFPAAFPAGIVNAPVPAAQLHPGPLPPNQGVPAPPVGHFPAAFPPGIVNAPVPAVQLHPGPLPPNHGIPAPPVGHFPAPNVPLPPPWAIPPGVHHVVVLNPGAIGGGAPNMPAPPVGNGTNIPPPLQPPPQVLQGINAFSNPTAFETQQYRLYERDQRRRLDTFQRDQASEERAVLTLWSAYCPSLQRVTFEMDFGRHVIWKRRGQVWKPSYSPNSSQKGRRLHAGRATATAFI